MRRVLVLNGPNLGRLGRRDPATYGTTTLAGIAERLTEVGRGLGLDVEVRQSDAEHEMIGWLHEAVDDALPVVLNAGAWTHYSYAVRDAASQVTDAGLVLIEVHLSNPHAREEFRHTSVLTPVASGTISGLGVTSYVAALHALADLAAG